MNISEEARKARNQYQKEYRQANKEKINEKQRAYRKEHPEAVKASNALYWERRAKQK